MKIQITHKTAISAICLLALTGCATHLPYTPPLPGTPVSSEEMVDKSYNDAWNSLVRELEEEQVTFLEKNKKEGVIIIGGGINTERHIDCGFIRLPAISSRNPNIVEYFPAAAAEKDYKDVENGKVLDISRKVSATAQARIKFYKTATNRITVQIKAQYELTEAITKKDGVSKYPARSANILAFATNTRASTDNGPHSITCTPTGALEKSLYDAI